MTLPFLAVGACGVVGVASHWTGAAQKEMIEAFAKGDVDSVPARSTRRSPSSYEFEGSDAYPNPLPTKAVMRRLGLPVGQCRLPMGAGTEELDAAADALLGSLGARRTEVQVVMPKPYASSSSVVSERSAATARSSKSRTGC